MAYQFKVGDEGLTKNGTPYRVRLTDVAGPRPILAELKHKLGYTPELFQADGSHFNAVDSSGFDLLPPKHTLEVRGFWIVVLNDGTPMDVNFISGERAQKVAKNTGNVVVYYEPREIEIEEPDNA